jgi:hypothetical protein
MNSKSSLSGILALAVVGGFWLYRNRESVQKFFEARGIQNPFDRSGRLADAIRSGVSKLKARQADSDLESSQLAG